MGFWRERLVSLCLWNPSPLVVHELIGRREEANEKKKWPVRSSPTHTLPSEDNLDEAIRKFLHSVEVFGEDKVSDF